MTEEGARAPSKLRCQRPVRGKNEDASTKPNEGIPDIGSRCWRFDAPPDGAGTRSIARSDPDTRTMGDVKTVDVAGSLFTNQ